jgi:pimeloyl-ACP methyl ester carboxylesterase
LQVDFARILGGLEQGPVSFAIPHPKSGEMQNVTLTRGVFVERLRTMLYGVSTASLVPLIIHRAARQDWTPFGRVVTRAAADSHYATAMGMYLSVTCSESVPFISDHEIARETTGTFMGDERIRIHQKACAQWPRGKIPPDYFRPVESTVPVLMFAGELDGATPARLGRDAAASLSNSRQIVLPGTAHEYAFACTSAIIAQFFAAASTNGLDTRCVENRRRPEFPRELPERYLR